MKKPLSKVIWLCSVIAAIAAMSVLLNAVIAGAQTNEDSKVVSAQPVSVAPLDLSIPEEEEKNVQWELDKGRPSQNSEKDLKPQDVANRAAKAIAEYFDTDTSDKTFFVGSAKNELLDKPLLAARCESEEFSYYVSMDSVTGTIYTALRAANTLTAYPDVENELYYNGEAELTEEVLVTPGDEEALRNQQMADPAYIQAAETFINEKFPDKTIAKVKNIYQGCVAGKVGVSTVLTAVDLTDGSGYMVQMGSETQTILEITYYPNGVVNYLKDEYEVDSEKLSTYDSLDD